MKLLPLLPACAAFGMVACETMTAPVSSSSFDPLTPPGSGRTMATVETAGFSPGQFVRATMDNTAFFNRRPRGNADADRLLARNTNMKVVSLDSSYVRVELDSGEVGFVPTVMVENPSGPDPTSFDTPNPNEFQVYPPLPGGTTLEPLPVFDDLPPADAFPTVEDPAGDALIEPEMAPVEESVVPLPPTTPELEAEALKEAETDQ